MISVTIIGTGAIGVSLLPQWVLVLKHSFDLDIRCVLTESALPFVSKTSLAMLTGHVVLEDKNWAVNGEVTHRQIASTTDLFIVCPATLNTIMKMHAGICDNLALASMAFSNAPKLVIPAVSGPPYESETFREAKAHLREMGVWILEPDSQSMSLHSGENEPGGMASLDSLVSNLPIYLSRLEMK